MIHLDIDNSHRHSGNSNKPDITALLIARFPGGNRFITCHAVEDGAMRAGSLIDPASLEALLVQIRDGRAATSRQIIDPRVLFHDHQSVAWIAPGAIRPMHFSINQSKWTFVVPWPTLVFFASNGKTSIAALKGNTRDPDQPVFHAPLMNIFSDCRVCQPAGTEIPEGLDGIHAAEDMMFNSAFSHTNHSNPISNAGKRPTDTVARYYKALQKAKSHPEKRFVPLNMTLQEWLSSR